MPFVTYLGLRCSVEAGDKDGGLVILDNAGTGGELREFMTGPDRQELLKSCAGRAEEKGMKQLAKRLWGISAEVNDERSGERSEQ